MSARLLQRSLPHACKPLGLRLLSDFSSAYPNFVYVVLNLDQDPFAAIGGTVLGGPLLRLSTAQKSLGGCVTCVFASRPPHLQKVENLLKVEPLRADLDGASASGYCDDDGRRPLPLPWPGHCHYHYDYHYGCAKCPLRIWGLLLDL